MHKQKGSGTTHWACEENIGKGCCECLKHECNPMPSTWKERFYNQFGNFGLYGKGDLGTSPDRLEEVLEFIAVERLAAAKEMMETNDRQALLDKMKSE